MAINHCSLLLVSINPCFYFMLQRKQFTAATTCRGGNVEKCQYLFDVGGLVDLFYFILFTNGTKNVKN